VSITGNLASRNLTGTSTATTEARPTINPSNSRRDKLLEAVSLVNPMGMPGDDGFPFGGTGFNVTRTSLVAVMEGSWQTTADQQATGGIAAERFGSAIMLAPPSGRRPKGTDFDIPAAVDVVKNMTANVAATLTNLLYQELPYRIDTMAGPQTTVNATMVQGRAMAPETFVHVRWEWLAFIVAQIGLSVIILGSAIVKTRYAGLDAVKSSAVAVLLAVPAEEKWWLEQKQGSGQTDALDLVVGRTKGVVGRFAPDGQGWRLR
jgi:hypothetical protein